MYNKTVEYKSTNKYNYRLIIGWADLKSNLST